MYASSLFAAAALLAAPLVSASTGYAIVQNECSFPAYLWSVASSSGPMVTVPAGTNYSEQYRTNSNGGGISIKIAAESDQNAGITQFEYTLAGTIWYDISNINGYPFEQWGVELVPSLASCTTKLCPAGITLCEDAYNQPDDNLATADCDASANLVLTLCPGGSTVSASSSSVKASSTAAATSTKASSSAVATTTSAKASTSSTTTYQTSTTVMTTGTTFITSTRPASSTSSSTTTIPSSSAVITSVAKAAVTSASSSSDAAEVVITTYVTSWTTVDYVPTSTQEQFWATQTHSHGHHDNFNNKREERRHVHRHARDIVA